MPYVYEINKQLVPEIPGASWVIGTSRVLTAKHPDSKVRFYDNMLLKYSDPDYFKVERQNQWNELLALTFPECIAAAVKQSPQSYNATLDGLSNQIQDPYIKTKFSEFRQQNRNKTFAISGNINFQQASQKLKDIDTKATNYVNASGDIFAEHYFNEQYQYLISQKYGTELGVLQNQASTLQRDLRNTNLTTQQILQKQTELKKVVTKLGISLSGFEFATNKKLGSIEEKLLKYGNLTEQLLLEVKLEKTPLDQRIKVLEDMLQRANDNLSTPISKTEIEQYLAKDKVLQKIEHQKQNLEIAQKAINYGQAGLELMNRLEIGTPKIRQFVSYSLQVANIGVNIYAGDFLGAFKSTMSLFKKPSPSPEMRMLSKILAKLDELEITITTGFRNLHNDLIAIHQDLASRLDFISYQITGLRMEMVKNHQQVVVSLNEIQDRLEYLTIQNNRLDSKLTALLGGEQDACYQPYIDWNYLHESSDTTRFIPSYLNSMIDGGVWRPCFDALLTTLTEDFVEGPKRSAFDYTVEPAEVEFQHLYNPKDLFKKQVGLWNNLYNTAAARDTAISSLLYPTAKVSEHRFPLDTLRKYQVKPVLNAAKTFTNIDYVNYKRVEQFANYVCDFYSLLAIFRNGQVLTPNGVNSDPIFLQSRSALLENGAKKVLNLVEKAIAQESLMAGSHLFEDFYNTLNSSKYSSNESGIGTQTLAIGSKIEVIFKILRSNPTMARNFASFCMIKAMRDNATFENNYKRYDDGIKKGVDFEKIIPLNTSQWLYLSVESDGLRLGIQKQYIKNVGGIFEIKEEHVYLPLVMGQEPIYQNSLTVGIKELYVVDNMIQTEGMGILQQARQKLKALIIEINVLKDVTREDQPNKISVKDLQFLVYNESMLKKDYDEYIASKMPQRLDINFMESVKSGNWSDPLTWSSNRVPTSLDLIIINPAHIITIIDAESKAKMLDNKGSLIFGNIRAKLQLSSF